MAGEVVMSKTFQEKIFERIRDQMGDLLTDEDLKRLTETAVQKAFFDPQITYDRYGAESGKKEPLFVEMMRKLVEEQASKAVKSWVESHPDEITKALDAALAKGVFGLMLQHFEMTTRWPLQEMVNKLTQKGVL